MLHRNLYYFPVEFFRIAFIFKMYIYIKKNTQRKRYSKCGREKKEIKDKKGIEKKKEKIEDQEI